MRRWNKVQRHDRGVSLSARRLSEKFYEALIFCFFFIKKKEIKKYKRMFKIL
jgi:hypothetical protein